MNNIKPLQLIKQIIADDEARMQQFLMAQVRADKTFMYKMLIHFSDRIQMPEHELYNYLCYRPISHFRRSNGQLGVHNQARLAKLYHELHMQAQDALALKNYIKSFAILTHAATYLRVVLSKETQQAQVLVKLYYDMHGTLEALCYSDLAPSLVEQMRKFLLTEMQHPLYEIPTDELHYFGLYLSLQHEQMVPNDMMDDVRQALLTMQSHPHLPTYLFTAIRFFEKQQLNWDLDLKKFDKENIQLLVSKFKSSEHIKLLKKIVETHELLAWVHPIRDQHFFEHILDIYIFDEDIEGFTSAHTQALKQGFPIKTYRKQLQQSPWMQQLFLQWLEDDLLSIAQQHLLWDASESQALLHHWLSNKVFQFQDIALTESLNDANFEDYIQRQKASIEMHNMQVGIENLDPRWVKRLERFGDAWAWQQTSKLTNAEQ